MSKNENRESWMVKEGMRVTRYPMTFQSPFVDGRLQPYQGTVAYVHPENRFHMVLFDNGIRECFFGVKI